uniref:Uncharacterized protein n=1 Tax=Leersia perrieri TaxID=77586 RepID=A0A0D9VGZ0_9ORYZ
MPSSPPSPATSAAAAVSTPRRRRHRLLPSSAGGGASFSSSSSSSSFSFFPPTSPSPFHRFLPSPLRASSVPFSWEHRPGIPKTPARPPPSSCPSKHAGGGALPLPPSLLSRASSDPYASAVVPAEFAGAMAPPPPLEFYTVGKTRRLRLGRRRGPRLGDALAEWLSVLSLYRSCKRAAACFAAGAKPAN